MFIMDKKIRKEYALYFLLFQTLGILFYTLDDSIGYLVLKATGLWWLIAFSALLGLFSLKTSIKSERNFTNLLVLILLPILLFENLVLAWLFDFPLSIIFLITMGLAAFSMLLATWKIEAEDNIFFPKAIKRMLFISKALFLFRLLSCIILLIMSILSRVMLNSAMEEAARSQFGSEYYATMENYTVQMETYC